MSERVTLGFLSYADPPFALHSGGRSHWFVDGGAIFADEHLRECVLDCWEREIRRIFPAAKKFCFLGIPRGGIPWAEAIAHRMGQVWYSASHPFIPREIVGVIIVVDDVFTTGASIGQVKDAKWALVVVARVPAWKYLPQMTIWVKIDLPLEE